ncbi:hypothetical protein IMCC20628_00919 [Hoeflea sp. IMCC20628]|uniref:hypothetical protein n=1 Tax=Hoeflea sp. IMCC20628 TaxID=1620421 RepID=UPI00063AF0DE|nr:hypothetical protein [Hoeflea sp. IMCC20628]AKH99638.1 hypothetical protein IMCC20628_00919 [Hoeflea sp. IMCC20628]
MPDFFPVTLSGSGAVSGAAVVDLTALPALPLRSAGGKSFTRIAPAVWPSPGAVDLVSQLLDLSGTAITHTATNSMPESDSDFWGMLAAALPKDVQD